MTILKIKFQYINFIYILKFKQISDKNKGLVCALYFEFVISLTHFFCIWNIREVLEPHASTICKMWYDQAVIQCFECFQWQIMF